MKPINGEMISAPAPAAHATQGDAHRVLADSGVTDDRTRVLKHGDTFAVFDHMGHIKPAGLGEEGLYHEGTRYLSRLALELDGRPPFFLGSTVRDENDQLSVSLTNPDEVSGGRIDVPIGTLHLSVRTFLWEGACHWRLRVENHGMDPTTPVVALAFASDFADIYEVRGMERAARGNDLPPEIGRDRVALGYVGLDGERRQALFRFSEAPSRLSASSAEFSLALGPREGTTIELAIACRRVEAAGEPPGYDEAREAAEAALGRWKEGACGVRASDGRFDAWLRRAESDLHMLATDLPTGPYPYAGVPWFNTPFGRDGIITALECLWFRPELARGVLGFLAATQATETIPAQDAEPGKILHETRNGEMAVLGEMPFGRYYGSADATPLFVLLAGAYYERTADRAFANRIWPHVAAALSWIDECGDRDGDGFVEYERGADDGLLHQGWKDSDDAISHEDGSLAAGPIATCEVQGYVYGAKQAAAVLAGALGMSSLASRLQGQADALRERFEAAFWCEDLGTYALALDGEKKQCRVRSSNAGHCLFAGIASTGRAARVAAGLMAPSMFSGWGVRTLDAGEARYNPMAYHNGTVWPHDNALIACGLGRYGMPEPALAILEGMFEAGTYFDLHRMPELFCGLPREPGEGPVLYPVACSPQAWAAGSAFLLLQSCLGLGASAVERQVWFARPRLPAFLPELRISDLLVGGAVVDLLLTRHGDDVGVRVVRQQGDLSIIVTK